MYSNYIEGFKSRLTTPSSLTPGRSTIRKEEPGSLFQSEYKTVEMPDVETARYCFHYIHQNPIKASLCMTFEDWPYSSFREYLDGTDEICKHETAYRLLSIPKEPLALTQASIEGIVNEKTRLGVVRRLTHATIEKVAGNREH